ncbi:hypothetical protein BpOF4_21774 (plasmid) [Alkalihalophilus pseudofirmus OF4]|uniref:Uncharacterized protein n=2 Tax=Bacillaceae TaxID=186817 RepID=D3G1X4_ALKPO|nr:hypothetical protein BpOF4_21774 [Alkalihalophilus pseudofirmus OF4]
MDKATSVNYLSFEQSTEEAFYNAGKYISEH